MSQKPKLSIIMRCWNRLEYTIRSIVSIDEMGGLTRDEYEIICIDQGSTDGTVQWLDTTMEEGYYPIKAVFLKENTGDGLGMNHGIQVAEGEFIAQHDNDIALDSEGYYVRLLMAYDLLEKNGVKVCSLGGRHKQGINYDTAPMKFAQKRYPNNYLLIDGRTFNQSAWVTAAFIFRRHFGISLPFTKGFCNAWCGTWWDRGYDNLLASYLLFWHIDSDHRGGEHVQRQKDKFPSYEYINLHYKKFVK